MRIAHYLARCGVASRRKSEEIIAAGRVKLNGEVVRDLGRQVEPDSDHVEVDGRRLVLPGEHLTLALNKPAGVVVTRDDPQGRTTVYDLLPVEFAGRARELVYVGRLDADTTGLLVLTTDGEMANRLMHPRHHVEKAYRATIDRVLDEEDLEVLREGIELEDFRAQPCRVARKGGTARAAEYEVCIAEGKKRQVRRMFEALGAGVLALERTRIGALTLQQLRLGEGSVVRLSPDQIRKLEQRPR